VLSSIHRFPADQIKHLVAVQSSSIKDESERSAFAALITPLLDAADPYTKSRSASVPGAERILSGFLDILREWISVERCFCDGLSYADAVDQLRRANKDNVSRILDLCRSHSSLKYSASIILAIIDSISAAGKTDANAPYLGSKIASVVLGADGLEDTTPCLTDIATMRGNETYDILSERCRAVLIEESLPSIEERMNKVQQAAETREEIRVQEVITENVVGSDILFPLLTKNRDASTQISILEVATRKQYSAYDLKEFTPMPDESALKFTYSTKRRASVFGSGAKLTSVTDLSKCLSNTKLSDMPSRSSSENSLQSLEAEGAVPSNVNRTSLMKIFNSMSDVNNDELNKLFTQFPQFNGDVPKCVTGPANSLSVFILQSEAGLNQNSIAEKFELLLSSHLEDLEKADIRRVSFLIPKEASGKNQYPLPSVFTYRETADFKEDHLYRDIEPEAAYHLDMLRMTKNFSVTCLGSHLSPTGQIYLYKATPKSSALAQDKKANKSPRLFTRAVSFVSDFSASNFERLLIEAFNAMESIKTAVPAGDNHLFLNVAGDSLNTVIDPVDVEQVVISILKRHTERATRLGLAEIETKATCIVAHDSHPISLRLVASNPTGFVPVVNTYVEAVDGSGNKRVFKSIGGTKANLACSGDSSWENMLVNAPYPLTRPFDAQRKAAVKSSDTLYCYDLPALFEAAVEKQWADASTTAAGSRPLMVMYTAELVVKNRFGGHHWTMQDYLDGNLELVETHRSAGKNDVGMVAWLMTLKTVEYPNVSAVHCFDVFYCLHHI
jgi:acetyl-CoA carboxylase/biotin carboxylase 1